MFIFKFIYFKKRNYIQMCNCHKIQYDPFGRILNSGEIEKNLQIINFKIYEDVDLLIVESKKKIKERKSKYFI